MGRARGGGCRLSVPQFPYRPAAAVLLVTRGPASTGVVLGLGQRAWLCHTGLLSSRCQRVPSAGDPDLVGGCEATRVQGLCVGAPEPSAGGTRGPSLVVVADELVPLCTTSGGFSALANRILERWAQDHRGVTLVSPLGWHRHMSRSGGTQCHRCAL